MFELPLTLPPEVRALFAKELRDGSLSEVLESASQVVLRLFNGRDVMCVLSESESSVPIVKFARSLNSKISPAFLESLPAVWCSSGIDGFVQSSLKKNLACISYSAFSWPFPGLPNSSENGFAIPRDYTLLMPMSSDMLVQHTGARRFCGYFALMFDEFPNLGATAVELIVSLPEFLSQLIAETLRRNSRVTAEDFRYGALAHDIKRHLLLAQEACLRLDSSGKEQSKTLAVLRRSNNRALALASTMLILERLQAGALKVHTHPMSVNEIVGEVVQASADNFAGRENDLHVELQSDLPMSSIDPALFPVVLENLLENSFKYSDPGSKVEIRTQKANDETVIIEISDRGLGIPEGEKERVFLQGFRGQGVQGLPGSGMGLYLVRHLVEAHNGRVYRGGPVDGGTKIVVELPILK